MIAPLSADLTIPVSGNTSMPIDLRAAQRDAGSASEGDRHLVSKRSGSFEQALLDKRTL